MTEPTITIQNLEGTGGATYTMIDNASGANWKFKATLSGGFKIRDHASGLDVIVVEPNSFANAGSAVTRGQAVRQLPLTMTPKTRQAGTGSLTGNKDINIPAQPEPPTQPG